jgi:hypothetical protein
MIYIELKFWPDKENRECPSDENVDYDNPYEILKHRQKLLLFYRNWISVYRTYYFILKWAIIVVPIVQMISNSLWASGITFIIWGLGMIYTYKKLILFFKFKFLAIHLVDPLITPYFGKLEPFD